MKTQRHKDMKTRFLCVSVFLCLCVFYSVPIVPQAGRSAGGPFVLTLQSRALASPLKLDGFYLETAQGRTELPSQLAQGPVTLPDGRMVALRVTREGKNFSVRLTAKPDSGIIRWGLSVDALNDEHYTGVMERVVDGPQQASWAPGIKHGMDLRGQKVDMIVKPTTSVYAPFYLSSRGYAVFVRGTWPGHFDFAAAKAERVQIDFEGPSFEMKVYTDEQLDSLVRQHALDAGPPFLPPKWVFTPWRWRDEHSQLSEYYDGTPVTGPFNSQVMEDLLMMKAYDIPTGVYWVDRPWGPGRLGYDDFEIDKQ